MVVQKAINNLKQGPKEDKVAVASGIAISVVAVLLVAWGILFFHNIQKGVQEVNLSGGVQDEFNFSGVKEAQQQLQDAYSNTDELRQIRDEAAARQVPSEVQSDMPQTQGTEIDPFGP